jgi:hypothetical protein
MPTLTQFFRWGTRFFLPNAIFTLFIVYLVLTYQQATAARGLSAPPSAPLVTSTFAYQGFLTSAAGEPINGNRALTFRLYSGSSGGTALWTEVRNTVTIQAGLFEVRLGEIVPIPAAVWDTPTLYLGVQVEAESELLPREAIGLVPVAQRSLTADLALTVPDGSITSNKLNPTGEQVFLGTEVTLTNEPQTILTTTLTIAHPARLLIIANLHMNVSNTFATGEVRLDNQPFNAAVILGHLANSNVGGTVSNTYLVDIQPGTHEIEIRGNLWDQSPGTGNVQAQSTSLTYFILSQ